ncbi:Asp-domain-containing protein [Hygrophoropsis aurantiaca]|uniref:Asp-domain-containing protein n=1 Tax=Hygrophoropsis aurantiaca TaxID=72124 RepID=A0ACB8A103_9AGAM|nr:Asp-domain-containing protein [Hygrophoropsis aurantiaca]
MRVTPGTIITAIPSITNNDGTVNIPALNAHLAQISLLFLLAVIDSHKREPGGDPLTNDANEIWIGEISVGTPRRSYSGKFLTSTLQPLTYKDLHKNFTITYADGTTAHGEQYSDVVALAGLTSKNYAGDGVLGTAFPSISNFNPMPVFQNLIAEHQTSEPVFAFKLATSGSELTLGARIRNYILGSLCIQRYQTGIGNLRPGWREITLDAISDNGKIISKSLDAIVDTGTTVIVADSIEVAALYTAVGGQDASSTLCSGFYTGTFASLTFGGQSFSVSPETFNLGPIAKGSSTCIGGIVAMDARFWLVGDAFLMNTYTVFDYGKKRVGFANLA